MKYQMAMILSCLSMQGIAQPLWTFQDEKTANNLTFDVRANKVRVVIPDQPFTTYGLPTELTLPLPDGQRVKFNIHPNNLLPLSLSLRYPTIKTYTGVSTADANSSGSFDVTEQGFHGMFTYQGRTYYIDPLFDGTSYAVYEHKDAWRRQEEDQVLNLPKVTGRSVLVNGNVRKQYTIAISATGEYTQYQGGTKPAALSAIATLLGRVNEVFRRDVGVQFQLDANNDKVIFTDPATDPFTNVTSQQDMDANQKEQRNQLGSGYDLGHLLATSGGGLSTVGSLCNSSYLSHGMTGSSQPSGDAFYIDYVAHELGHQLGAEHSFNGTTDSCGSQRNASSAWEPGSGSTIMAYAGICGDENLQSNSAPFFHSKSIEQMRTLIDGLPGCGSNLSLSNNALVANAGTNKVIPANTPFTLSGSAVDLDGNSLTYTWEELDLGTASNSAATMGDDGSRPLFRFVEPGNTPTRTLPAMTSLLSGTLAKGEAWPTTNRSMNFRLTVRDGQGAVSYDEMSVQVVNTGTAFAITAPLASQMLAGKAQTLSWNVAGTDQPPISCPSVDVALTQNNGQSWTTVASGLANNGTAQITLPTQLNSSATLRLACSNNIFFALNVPRANSSTGGSAGGNTGGSTGTNSGGGGGGSLGLLWLMLMAGGLIWRKRIV